MITFLNSLLSSQIRDFTTQRLTYEDMRNALAPSLSSVPSAVASGKGIITLGYNKGPGAILVGVGNTSTLAVPSREQLYNCQDGNNATLYICKWFILPPGKSVETLFSVRGLKNHVYTATVNSYIYRPLGSSGPTGTTVVTSQA